MSESATVRRQQAMFAASRRRERRLNFFATAISTLFIGVAFLGSWAALVVIFYAFFA